MLTNPYVDTMLSSFRPSLRRRSLPSFLLVTAASYRHALADTPDATATVEHLNEALLAAMKTGTQTAFNRRFSALAPVVDQVFDLHTVLAISVGPDWSNLSPDQQSRLLDVFRRYTVASYLASFDRYDGQVFSVIPNPRCLDADRAVVQSRIAAIHGETTELDYVMQRMLSGWKIVDMLAAGTISRVAVQRSDFRRVLSQGGGEALLASLQRKTIELSGGALA